MKKIVLVVFILTSLQVLSQDLKLGLVVTPHVTWMTSENKIAKNDGARMGFGFGFTGDYYFSEHYAFNFGVTINSFTGGKIKFTEEVPFVTADTTEHLPANTSVTYKLQYLEIPLGLKLNTNRIGYFSYFGQFGFAPGVRLNARGEASGGIFDKVKITDEVSIFNLSYFVGAGLQYWLGATEKASAITLGVIYKKGINDITIDDARPKSDKITLGNVTLQVGIIF